MSPDAIRKHMSTAGIFLLVTIASSLLTVTLADEPALFRADQNVPFLTDLMLDDPASVADSPVVFDPLDARFAALENELKSLKASLEKPKAMTLPAIVYPTVKVTGFFQADAGWFHQDAASRTQFGDIQDGRGFRRTRLAAVGNVSETVSYQLEMDFAFNGRPSFMDVWLDVAKVPVFGNVRIGQWRQPFGLDELTSVKELTFLERPLMFGMAPFRQFGVGFHDTSDDKNATWAGSIFGTATDPFGNSIGDRGYGGAARVTKVLLEDPCSDFLIHLGGSYIATPNSRIQYRNVPEYGGPFDGPTGIAGTVPFFVDTTPIAAENANLFNVELAGTWGPVHAQSEFRYSVVNTNSGNNAGFSAFYAQAGWILTGEHRPYNKASATLWRIKPNHPIGSQLGGGAVELAFRYSWIDLNDNGITGGELADVTYGVNWYLNNFTKLQFNYINADLNRAPVGNSATDIFAVRAQLNF